MISALCDALNAGVLSSDYFAIAEQSIRGPIPHVLTLRLAPGHTEPVGKSRALAVATAPPATRIVKRGPEVLVYARKADHVSIRHRDGKIVAVIEIVSPGNKASNSELRAFVEKTSDLIQRGIALLVIDLFPPGKLDPQGIHQAIWDEIEATDFDLPLDKQRIVAAYDAGPPPAAYVEPISVGDVLPDMPLFLMPEHDVPTPLESAYQSTWTVFPDALKGLLESPSGNGPETR
jgi:hypothetical protein